MKGAFGGGFSIVGIPLLSIVMDPVTAGGLLAPLFIAMDLFALRYWKPSTWSKPDLVLLFTGARDRHRVRPSPVPLPRSPRHRDRDGGDHPDLCRPMACCGRGDDDPSAFDAEGDHRRSRLGGSPSSTSPLRNVMREPGVPALRTPSGDIPRPKQSAPIACALRETGQPE